MGWDRRRFGLAGGLAFAVLVTAVAGFRVFAPADTVDAATTPYPQPVAARVGVYGEMMRAPLIVANRLRVYGAKNRVWADGPVDTKMSTSAYWSFRRWPAQLVGVVISADRLVVSKWSDGQLIALDPPTGKVAWRAGAEAGVTSYQGRRTGASTLYAPPDLYTATGPDGRGVVVSVGAGGALVGFDGATGRELWRQRGVRPECPRDFTAPGVVVVVNGCRAPSIVDVYDAATGRPRGWPAAVADTADLKPVGCAVGRSECTGMAGASGGWLIGADGGLVPAPALAGPDVWLVGRTAVHGDDSGLLGYDAVTGTVRWAWPPVGGGIAGTKIIAVEPGAVHVVTHFRDLITLDVNTGRERCHFTAKAFPSDGRWVPGYGYAYRGYVAIERLRPGISPDRLDSEYYYPVPTMIFAGT